MASKKTALLANLDWGKTLAAAFLILYGVQTQTLMKISFPYQEVVLAGVAVAAGVCLLLGK